MVIATHVDTNHIHNHLVVNSVSCVDGILRHVVQRPPHCAAALMLAVDRGEGCHHRTSRARRWTCSQSDMQRKKTAIITARMTPEDKQKIEQRAANAGMTVTDYLTTCAWGGGPGGSAPASAARRIAGRDACPI